MTTTQSATTSPVQAVLATDPRPAVAAAGTTPRSCDR